MKNKKLRYPAQSENITVQRFTPTKTSPLVITALCICTVMLASWVLALCAIFGTALEKRVIEYGLKQQFVPPSYTQKETEPENNKNLEIVPYEGELPKVELNSLPDDDELTTEQIVEMVEPCVVGILTYQENKGVLGNGSGIIISEDGFIITNAHVVNNSTRLEVVVGDDQIYEGTIIGMDLRTDLAVVKIEASGLPVAVLGNSDDIKVGTRAIAIGNPGGLANTVTQGIISAKDRRLTIPVSDDIKASLTLLQTDASINPGNSGGALVNKYGQIIGINSAKMNTTTYEGIGFAIPISLAKPVIEELMVNGRITDRAILGVTVIPISHDDNQDEELPDNGLLIVELAGNSPLIDKGIIAGDVIVGVNGRKCEDTKALTEEINASKPGDDITLDIYITQLKKQRTVTVTLIEDE